MASGEIVPRKSSGLEIPEIVDAELLEPTRQATLSALGGPSSEVVMKDMGEQQRIRTGGRFDIVVRRYMLSPAPARLDAPVIDSTAVEIPELGQ